MWRADSPSGAPDLSLYRAAAVALATLVALLVLLLALDWMLRGDTVPVRNMRFEGEFRHVTAEELELAVRDAVRGNFLLLDLESIRRRVETLPWVHRAAVRRSWPRDIAVQFTEQQPVARWSEFATAPSLSRGLRLGTIGESWVNHVGEEIHVDGVDLPSDAPNLAGPAGTSAVVLEHYQGFSALLAPAGLGIKRLTMTARRTWEVELSALRATTREADGMLVILDREDAGRKLERFARLYQPVLATQATGIRRVDLRYSNGLAVEWRSGGAETRPSKPAGSRESAPKEG
jgi:cell division protein FtsQ